MSISITRQIVGAVLLMMGIWQASLARDVNHWVFLGQTEVNGQRDFDRIIVGRAEGRFDSIQLRVQGAPVEFYRVVVNYANGTNEEIVLRDRIPAGGQTRVLDLRGDNRVISSIDFRYAQGHGWPRFHPRVSVYAR